MLSLYNGSVSNCPALAEQLSGSLITAIYYKKKEIVIIKERTNNRDSADNPNNDLFSKHLVHIFHKQICHNTWPDTRPVCCSYVFPFLHIMRPR